MHVTGANRVMHEIVTKARAGVYPSGSKFLQLLGNSMSNVLGSIGST